MIAQPRGRASYDRTATGRRVRCDGHQIHKTLLELIAILGQLLRKMCKASNSLTMHGTFQNLRKQAAEYFKSKSNVTEEEPSYEAQRYGQACMDAMFGPFDQLTPLEAKRRVAVENILNGHLGDMDRILHHNGGDSVRMSKEELDRMIDLELIPALFPATVQLWNLARWNKNKQIIRSLLRMLMVHGALYTIYPGLVRKHIARGDKQSFASIADAIVPAAGGGVDAIVPMDAQDTGTTADLYRAQALRARSTKAWACEPPSAGGTAISDLTHLSILSSIYDTMMQQILHTAGEEYDDEQMVMEEEHGRRRYRLMDCATGTISLPVVIETSKLLHHAWISDAWLPFTRQRGITRNTVHFVFKTTNKRSWSADSGSTPTGNF